MTALHVRAVGRYVTIGYDADLTIPVVEVPLDKLAHVMHNLPHQPGAMSAQAALISAIDLVSTSTYTEAAKECKAVIHQLRTLAGAEEVAKQIDQDEDD